MFSSAPAEGGAAENSEPGNEADEDEKKDNEATIEENVNPDGDVVETAEVPTETDLVDSSKMSSAAPTITGVVLLVVAAAGGAVWSKKNKLSR